MLEHVRRRKFQIKVIFNNGDSKQLKESLPQIAVCLRSGPGPVVLRPESCVGPASCTRVQPGLGDNTLRRKTRL